MARSIWDKSETDLEQDVTSGAGKVASVIQNQAKKQADDTTKAIVAQLFGIDTTKGDKQNQQTQQGSTQNPQMTATQGQKVLQTQQTPEQLASGQQTQQQSLPQDMQVIPNNLSWEQKKKMEEEKKKKEHEKQHREEYYKPTIGEVDDQVRKDQSIEEQKKKEAKQSEEEEREKEKKQAEEKKKEEFVRPTQKGRMRMGMSMAQKKTEVFRGASG